MLRLQLILSMFDQALVSLTNLGVGFFFVHFSTKDAYALYSIAFGLISLAIGFGNALIYTPLLVAHHEQQPAEGHRYAQAMLLAQWIYFVPFIAVVGVSFALYFLFFAGNSDLAVLSVCIVLASTAALFHEYFRRYFFLSGNTAVVCGIDGLFALVMFGSLFSFWYQELQGMQIFGALSYACAGFVAGGFGFLSAHWKTRLRNGDIWNALGDSWKNGKWSLGGVSVTWVQNQCYAYFLAFTGSAASLAEANAARLLLAPVSLLSTSILNVMMPRMAKAHAAGDIKKTLRQGKNITVTVCSLLVIYSSIIYAFGNTLTEWVLTKEYHQSQEYIVIWTAILLFQNLRNNSSILLQVFRAFRPLAVANLISALVVLGTTYILILQFGAAGSLTALGIGEALFAALLWNALRVELAVRRTTKPTITSPQAEVSDAN